MDIITLKLEKEDQHQKTNACKDRRSIIKSASNCVLETSNHKLERALWNILIGTREGESS